jgi:hypothetical protein
LYHRNIWKKNQRSHSILLLLLLIEKYYTNCWFIYREWVDRRIVLQKMEILSRCLE